MSDEYDDFRHHYEDCPRCKPWTPCPVAVEILRKQSLREAWAQNSAREFDWRQPR